MSLADALEATRPEPEPCRVGKILRELDETNREILAYALDPESGWKHSQISKALASEEIGIKVAQHQIGRHRNGGCSCP